MICSSLPEVPDGLESLKRKRMSDDSEAGTGDSAKRLRQSTTDVPAREGRVQDEITESRAPQRAEGSWDAAAILSRVLAIRDRRRALRLGGTNVGRR